MTVFCAKCGQHIKRNGGIVGKRYLCSTCTYLETLSQPKYVYPKRWVYLYYPGS